MVVVVLRGGVVVVVGCGVVAEAGAGVRMTKGLGVDMAKRIGAANMLGAAVRGGDPDFVVAGSGAANRLGVAVRGGDPDFVVAGSGAANRSGVAVTDHPPGCVATAPLLTAKPVIPTKEAATISPATGYLFAKSARNSGCRVVACIALGGQPEVALGHRGVGAGQQGADLTQRVVPTDAVAHRVEVGPCHRSPDGVGTLVFGRQAHSFSARWTMSTVRLDPDPDPDLRGHPALRPRQDPLARQQVGHVPVEDGR